MNGKFSYALAFATLVPVMGITVQAADQAQTKNQANNQAQIRDSNIYGYQMMTREERDEYRAKMHVARTTEEREQIRREHHDQMVGRAKERGVTIPDEPPMRDAGPGPGMAPGGGMGPGGAAGSGRGPR